MLSLEAKFSEVCDALTAAGHKEKVVEIGGKKVPIEAKFNEAEAYLREHPVGFKVRRNNGAGTYVQESEAVTARRKSDTILYKALNLSEAQIAKLEGDLPEKAEKWNEVQLRDYRFGRGIGLSESDAIRLAEKGI
jgi:hypothetical protein